jgi:hypothetical protein
MTKLPMVTIRKSSVANRGTVLNVKKLNSNQTNTTFCVILTLAYVAALAQQVNPTEISQP